MLYGIKILSLGLQKQCPPDSLLRYISDYADECTLSLGKERTESSILTRLYYVWRLCGVRTLGINQRHGKETMNWTS